MRGGTSNRTGPHGWFWQMRNTRPVGALDASDGYQLFAYSHLASLAGARGATPCITAMCIALGRRKVEIQTLPSFPR
jgi:hypothetical protein